MLTLRTRGSLFLLSSDVVIRARHARAAAVHRRALIIGPAHRRRSKGSFDWPTLKTGLRMVAHEHRRGGSVAETVKKGARITGADRAKLAGELTKKYTNGASIRALAEETGRSYGFVHRILTENDVSLRSRGGATRGKSKTR
jgi:hypothetical protein